MQTFKRLSDSAFNWLSPFSSSSWAPTSTSTPATPSASTSAVSSAPPSLPLAPPPLLASAFSFPPSQIQSPTFQRFQYPSPASNSGSRRADVYDDTMYDLSEVEEDGYDTNEVLASLNISESDHDFDRNFAEYSLLEEPSYESILRAQKRESLRMLQDGWSLDTIELWTLLQRREYEVLFEDHWRSEFPLFCGLVFTTRHNAGTGLLRSLSPNYDHTIKWAFTKFIELGARVRDSNRPNGHTFYKRRPEGLIEDHIKHYAKMVYKDAGLERYVRKKYLVPMISFASAMYGTPTNILEARITQKLRRRAARLMDLLRVDNNTNSTQLKAARKRKTLIEHEGETYLYEPPTVYGVVNAQTVCALVAYEPLSRCDAVRQIAFFHFSKEIYDVWNCVALALMICHCRDHMMRMKRVLPDRSEEEYTDLDEDDE